MAVETIEYKGIRYAEIIWNDTRVDKTTFFFSTRIIFSVWITCTQGCFC